MVGWWFGYGPQEGASDLVRLAITAEIDGLCLYCLIIDTYKLSRLNRFVAYDRESTSYPFSVISVAHGESVDLSDSDTRDDVAKAIRRAVVEGRTGKDCRRLLYSGDQMIPSYWKIDVSSAVAGPHFRVDAVVGITYEGLPDDLSRAIAREAQEAVKWFHPKDFPDFSFDAVPTKRRISNQEVRDRIQGFQFSMDKEIARLTTFGWESFWGYGYGSNWREMHNEWIARYNEAIKIVKDMQNATEVHQCERYDLSRLPWIVQRALVTRWEVLWEAYDGQYHPVLGFTGADRIISHETALGPNDISLVVHFLFPKGG